ITWATFSFLFTAPASERGRDIAFVEFMRLFCGAAIYFAALYFCRSRRHLRLASLVLLLGCIAVALSGVLSFSPSPKEYSTAGLGDNQLLGAFLTGLLPLTVVLAASGDTKGRRFLAWVAMLLVSCALLLTGNRSGWLGGVVGLLVVTVLACRAGIIQFTNIRRLARQIRVSLTAV